MSHPDLHLSETAFDPILDVDCAVTTSLGHRQLQEATRAMPVLVLFHFIAAISIHFIAIDKVPNLILLSWQVMVLVAGSAFLLIFFSWKSNPGKSILPLGQISLNFMTNKMQETFLLFVCHLESLFEPS